MKGLRLGIVCIFGGIFLTSCSGMFGGKVVDSKVANQKNFRQPNGACSNLQLSSSQLSVVSFRAMINCFNANGTLEPVAKLIQSMSDSELTPVVKLANDSMFANPKNLYLVELTYNALSKTGLLNETFSQATQLLKNKEFILSSLQFLNGAYIKGKTPASSSSDHKDQEIQNPLLIAIELIAERWTHKDWNRFLDLALSITSSKAFQALFEQIKTEPDTSSYSYETAIDFLTYYLYEDHTYTCGSRKGMPQGRFPISYDLWKAFQATNLQELVQTEGGDQPSVSGKKEVPEGVLFHSLNEVFGETEEQLKLRIPDLASIFQANLDKDLNPDGAKNLALAFNALQRQSISCMGGAVEIPDAVMHLMLELAFHSGNPTGEPTSFTLRDQRLYLSILQPFCKYPPNLNQHYLTLTKLAEVGYNIHGAPRTGVNFLTSLLTKFMKPGMTGAKCAQEDEKGVFYRPLITLLENLMGDVGTHPHPALKLPNGNYKDGGIHNLIPLLSRVTDQDLWHPLLLVAALPTLQQQIQIKEIIEYWNLPQPRLDGKTIYDVLVKSNFGLDDLSRLKAVFMAARGYTELDVDLFSKVFTTLRRINYLNNARPFLDTTLDLSQHATQHAALFDTLFAISTAERKALFEAAMDHVSKMATDGSLDALIQATLTLFHQFAQGGGEKVIVKEMKEPDFVYGLRHNLVEADLKLHGRLIALRPSDLKLSPSCDQINLDEKFLGRNFDSRIHKVLACQQENFDEFLASSLTTLQSTQTSTGKGFLKDQADLMIDLFAPGSSPWMAGFSADRAALTKDELEQLLTNTRDSIQNENLIRLLKVLPLAMNGTSDSAEPLLRPVFDLASSILSTQEEQWRHLTGFGASFLRREDFPTHLTAGKELFDRTTIVESEMKTLEPIGIPPGEWDCPVNGRVPRRVKKFLNRIVLEDAWDLKWNSKDDEARPLAILKIIRDWVAVKECDAIPAPGSGDREQVLWTRACEVVRDAVLATTNFDWNPETQQVKQDWNMEQIKDLMDPILQKFKPEALNLDRPATETVVNTLDYFTLAKGEAENEKKRYPPDELLQWLFERSVRYKLITYFYIGDNNYRADKRRVRLVNPLDKFDIVLNMVDFDAAFPIGKNMAMQFLSELAISFGDEDPSARPKNISEPSLTLLETVEGIIDRYRRKGIKYVFEDLTNLTDYFVGLPEIASCPLPSPGESPSPAYIPEDKKSKINEHPWLKWVESGLLSPFISKAQNNQIQGRLYNLWQVRDVLIENSPNWQTQKAAFEPSHPRLEPGKMMSEQEASWLHSAAHKTIWTFEGHQGPSQVHEFIKKSEPEREEGTPVTYPFGRIPGNPGLRVLRDHFYEVYFSNRPETIESRAGNDNNLIMVLRAVRGGVLRQVGRLLQQHAHFKLDKYGTPLLDDVMKLPILDDPKLVRFFRTLVHSAAVPGMRELMTQILEKGTFIDGDGQQQEFIYKMMEPIFAIIDRAVGTEDHHPTQKDLQRFSNLQNLPIHAFAAFDRMSLWRPGKKEVNGDGLSLLLKQLRVIVTKNQSFLASPAGAAVFKDLIGWKKMAALMEVAYQFDPSDTDSGKSQPFTRAQQRREDFYSLLKDMLCESTDGLHCKNPGPENRRPLPIQSGIDILKHIYKDPSLKQQFHAVSSRLDSFLNSTDYAGLGVREALEPALEFFEENQGSLPLKLRLFLADLIESGALDEPIRLYSQNPDVFYQALADIAEQANLSDYGGLENLIKLVQRALLEKPF